MVLQIKKIIEKIKNFFKSDIRRAVLVLFILQFAVHIWITPDRYDSVYFMQKAHEMRLLDFVNMRYHTWTSRVISEFITCIVLTHNKIWWILISTLMMTLFGYSIFKIFTTEDNRNLVWISLCFILIYPMYKIASAGWGVGTIVYTWSMGTLAFACIAVKKMVQDEKIQKWMYPIYFVS